MSIIKVLQQEKNIAQGGEMWITLPDQIILVPFELIKVDLDDELCWLRLLREDESFSQVFKRSPEVKCFFPNSGVYSFSKYHSFSNDSQILKAKLPEVLFSKERRKDERFDIDGQLNLKIDFDGHSRTYKIFDISKGGVSIILAKTDHFPFDTDDGPITAVLGPYGVKMKVEITSKLKVKPFVFEKIPYAGHKVSFKFSFAQESESVRWGKIWPQVQNVIS